MKKIIITVSIIILNFCILESFSQALLIMLDPGKWVPTTIAFENDQFGWLFSGCRNQSEVGLGDFELCFNAQHLRGQDSRLRNSKKLYIGNSVTLAQHVPDNETFVFLTQGLNAGFDGYSFHQIKDRYVHDLASSLRLKELVLVINTHRFLSLKHSEKNIRKTLWSNLSIKRKNVVLDTLRREGIWQLYLWNLKRQKSDQAKVDSDILKEINAPIDQKSWDDWTKAVLEIQSVSKKHGTQLKVILSPTRAEVTHFKNYAATKNLRTAQIESFLEQHNIPFINLLPVLGPYPAPDLFVDHLHFSAQGHLQEQQNHKEF